MKNLSFSPPSNGDVVQIHDDCPRVTWKLGIVTELLPSSDNIVRSVKLRTGIGCLTRHVTKVYPLEIDCDFEKSDPEDIIKPKRAAAILAAQKLKSCV